MVKLKVVSPCGTYRTTMECTEAEAGAYAAALRADGCKVTIVKAA